MATLILRNQKGSPLTNNEVDGNFSALNTELATHTTNLSTLNAHIGATGVAHALVTTSVAGFMSSTDKTRIDYLFGDTNTQATTAVLGKVLLADTTEANAGTDNFKVVTPAAMYSAITNRLNTFSTTNNTSLDSKIPLTQKAAVNGVATLGSDGKVPTSQLPSFDYIPNSLKAVASGVATLNSSSKVIQTALNADYATSAGSATNATNATYSNSASAIWNSAALNGVMAINDASSSAQFKNINNATGDSGMAMVAFHCQGSYAIKMGLRADGYFGLGGWSRPVWSWYSDNSGNMVAAGNVAAYSDPRLKENFEIIKDPISIIKKLDGGTFTWKHGIPHTECKAGNRDYGVLADQVEAVMPEIVSQSIEYGGESYKTVSYEKLVPVLLEALKLLTARVEELEK